MSEFGRGACGQAAAAGLAFSLCMPTAASAQPAEPALKALRVCQDPNNLPFSSDKGGGIENRIAELFGRQLNVPVEYFSFPQRMGFVRNTLRYKLPGQDYRCDVILGVPAGWGQASATKPYYRSTYALVFRRGGTFDGVRSGTDFLAKVKGMQRKPRIGLHDKSPASAWLAKYDLVDAAVVYPILSADPEQYPGEIVAKSLANDEIDVAVVWGPIAAYYATRVPGAEFAVVPLKSEPDVRFHYAIAMGVRYGEPQWKARIEELIDSNKEAIHDILEEFGVPLVDEQGDPLRK